MSSKISQPFRPRARLLQLLGDELIGNARLAIFELVKNSYDADANDAIVHFSLDNAEESSITVTDDGHGMTPDEIREVWLEPGNDHRLQQRRDNRRSPLHNRLPLGEKGLGRFAVHKLGNLIKLVTRASDSDECSVEIDWRELIEQPYLDSFPVTIHVGVPETFTGDNTGTRIEIRQLRANWTRGEIRRLYTQITSICSPFEQQSEFQAKLLVSGKEEWISDLPDVSEILRNAIWKFSFNVDDNGKFDWKYDFRQVPGLNLEPRSTNKSAEPLQLFEKKGASWTTEKTIAKQPEFEGVGPVSGVFYAYDRDTPLRQFLPNFANVRNYLDKNGGIRVYRDGIRVYDYGEPGDDWLGLDLQRVNRPTFRVSRNLVLGAVNLSLQHSTGLIEKTSREGFVENDSYHRFRAIVRSVLGTFEPERNIDKERIRIVTRKPSDPETDRFEKPLEEMRRELDKRRIRDEFEVHLKKIENNYYSMQEILLSAGISGLNLAVVFHEVERGVRFLYKSILDGIDMENAARQARDLTELLDGFAILLKRDSKKVHSLSRLANTACKFSELRFRWHNINVTNNFAQQNNDGIKSRFAFNLVSGALNNLLDNSIYWLRVRHSETDVTKSPSDRKIYIGLSDEFDVGPSIVVADNGTGFRGDDPATLVRPFFTRKTEGMGLGLFYANLVMQLNGGQIAFPSPKEIKIPEEFDGAVIAMIFERMD